MTAERQYLSIIEDIISNGVWVDNERTNSRCLTVLNKQIVMQPDEFPLLTTKKMFWKQAICEMLCYIRAYTKLSDFHSLGVHTWDKNAKGWAENVSTDPSTGIIYGASAKKVRFSYLDLLEQIKSKPNDRGHIWNFWNPEYFDQGCLRPCMYAHQFTVLDGELHLTSSQRSADMGLGEPWNMVQAWFLNFITAKFIGLKQGSTTINLVNCHLYENQLKQAKEQVLRSPYSPPKFVVLKDFTLEDILTNITKDNFDEYFAIQDYQHHPSIKYPFTA